MFRNKLSNNKDPFDNAFSTSWFPNPAHCASVAGDECDVACLRPPKTTDLYTQRAQGARTRASLLTAALNGIVLERATTRPRELFMRRSSDGNISKFHVEWNLDASLERASRVSCDIVISRDVILCVFIELHQCMKLSYLENSRAYVISEFREHCIF